MKFENQIYIGYFHILRSVPPPPGSKNWLRPWWKLFQDFGCVAGEIWNTTRTIPDFSQCNNALSGNIFSNFHIFTFKTKIAKLEIIVKIAHKHIIVCRCDRYRAILALYSHSCYLDHTYLPISNCRKPSKGTCHDEIGLRVQKTDSTLGST